MTTQHHSTTEEFKSRALDIAKARDANRADPAVPNRTKVVRLIVVPPEVSESRERDAVRNFAMARHATRADTFVVRRNGQWVAESWLGQGLVDHHRAHHDHAESVLVLMVEDREQVQWESDVPFKIASIGKAEDNEKDNQAQAKASHHFPSSGEGPDGDRLFRDTLFNDVGYPGRPIVSGPPTMNGGAPYNQLYKVSFLMMLPGNRDWTPVDPDIYCDWS